MYKVSISKWFGWLLLAVFVGSLGLSGKLLLYPSQTLFPKKCADFASREEAQKAFDAYGDAYSNLDGRDKDGKVCETTEYP